MLNKASDQIKGIKLYIANLILVMCMLVLFPGLAANAANLMDLTDSELFDNHGSIMLIIDAENGHIVDANKSAIEFYGYDEDLLYTHSISDINMLSPEEVSAEMEAAVNEQRNYFNFRHRMADGSVRAVEVHSYPFTYDGRPMLFSIIHDVTSRYEIEARNSEIVRMLVLLASVTFILVFTALIIQFRNLRRRKEMEMQLKNSKDEYEQLFGSLQEGYALHEIILDKAGKPCDYRFLRVNRSFEEITGLNGSDICGRRVLEVMPQTESYWIERYGDVAVNGGEIELDEFSSELGRYYSVKAYQAGDGHFITVFLDITDAKEKEREVRFLSDHDKLTGLYNRHYMESQLQLLANPKYLPLSIVMADVNGLKLTNDAFGHDMGDDLLKMTADLFQDVFKEPNIVARIGGDEFVVLLPNISKDLLIPMLNELGGKMKASNLGPIPLSISIGDATRNAITEDIQQIFKEAEDLMYRQKLTESVSTRTNIVQSIFKQMENEHRDIYDHQIRVRQLVEQTFDVFNIEERNKEKLLMAAAHHDVGLLVVDKSIVNSVDVLSENEFLELRRHSECGYRILSAISEYSAASEIVLAHHERFDGSGYPKNLRGNDIPYLSRVLSILDAYDSMTNKGHYSRLYTKEEAIEELRNNAGGQFDPDVVERFITWLG